MAVRWRWVLMEIITKLLITSEYMNQVLVLIITFYAFHISDMAFLCFCVYV